MLRDTISLGIHVVGPEDAAGKGRHGDVVDVEDRWHHLSTVLMTWRRLSVILFIENTVTVCLQCLTDLSFVSSLVHFARLRNPRC